ncbi:MAG: DUF3784 domain-containing protein, partial [Ethanoligenens sp.]
MNPQIVLTILFVILGVVFMTGNGDFLIAGYNLKSEEEKKKYLTTLKPLDATVEMDSVSNGSRSQSFGKQVSRVEKQRKKDQLKKADVRIHKGFGGEGEITFVPKSGKDKKKNSKFNKDNEDEPVDPS